ncbi:MAG TPA: TonB family protein [Candidatus Binataceae bacterium]
MKTCPQCERTYGDSENFCPIDGSALVTTGAEAPESRAKSAVTVATSADLAAEAPIDCPICGGRAQPGEEICNFCGARLGPEGSAAAPLRQAALQQATSRTPPPPQSSNPARAGGGAQYEGGPSASGLPQQVEGRSRLSIVGWIIAALIALLGGIWFALHLSGRNEEAANPAASAVATASAAPLPSGPYVALATNLAIQITGSSASAPPRNQDAAKTAFENNQSGLLDDYIKAFGATTPVRDGMIVALTVDPSGVVTGATVKTSTDPNPSLDATAVKNMIGWKFDPVSGAGPVEIDYPVIFNSNPAKQAGLETALADKAGKFGSADTPEYAYAPAASPTVEAVASSPASVPTPFVASGGGEPIAPVASRKKRGAARPAPTPSLITQVQDALRADRRLNGANAYTNPGGVVVLFGQVFDDKAKTLAMKTINSTPGVTGVVDNMTTSTGAWLLEQNQINTALRLSGLTNVQATVIGKDAYLSGQVSSNEESNQAVSITQSTAPVTVKTNLIRIVPKGLF